MTNTLTTTIVTPEPATEPLGTRKTQPGFAVPEVASEPDLESRIKARRAQVIAELVELRASTRVEAAVAGDKRKAKLSQLSHIIKENVVDGWAGLGDAATKKLEGWLAESQAPVPAPSTPGKPGQS